MILERLQKDLQVLRNIYGQHKNFFSQQQIASLKELSGLEKDMGTFIEVLEDMEDYGGHQRSRDPR